MRLSSIADGFGMEMMFGGERVHPPPPCREIRTGHWETGSAAIIKLRAVCPAKVLVRAVLLGVPILRGRRSDTERFLSFESFESTWTTVRFCSRTYREGPSSIKSAR